MKIKILAVALCAHMLLSMPTQAAFPVHTATTISTDTTIRNAGAPTQNDTAAPANNNPNTDTKPVYKKRGKARFLAIIGAIPFLFLPMGLHRIYLGYTRQGWLRLAGGYGFIILTGIAFAISPVVGVVAGLFLIDAFFALLIWQIVDAVHIRNGKLQPKDGMYRDRKTGRQ